MAFLAHHLLFESASRDPVAECLVDDQARLDYGQPDIRPALAATLDSVPDFRPGSGWRRESLDNVGANYLQMPGVSRA